ncbi:desulfoferrodoxin [bacterium]|nr:desulfoferrodoxin [bacterium]
MTKLSEVYKCPICGNIVKVYHAGAGELVCCGQPMNLQEENKEDADKEKHVPVVEKIDGGFKVSVGSVLHPMEEEHYLEWIEIIYDGKCSCKRLKPGDKPELEFLVEAESVKARTYCNLHGLWSGK